MYQKILLPTDGSKFAEKAAKHAIWIASRSGAEIIVLNVIETSSLVGLPAEDLIVKIKEMLKEEGRRSLERISEMITQSEGESKIKDLKITLTTEEGSPADSILKTIENENIDLVVMGTSG
ncbi:universal stress protein, partial [Methanobacterium sp. MZD130B]|uniref:universal stress protein n=1 Tax=Methanobacterium sp. MZD130B TaxID=3394378 RepID=UPI0039FC4FE3